MSFLMLSSSDSVSEIFDAKRFESIFKVSAASAGTISKVRQAVAFAACAADDTANNSLSADDNVSPDSNTATKRRVTQEWRKDHNAFISSEVKVEKHCGKSAHFYKTKLRIVKRLMMSSYVRRKFKLI